MPQNISEARRSLAKARDAARSRLEKLEQERQQTNASVKALDAAIKALDKNATSAPLEESRTKTAATTKDVIKLVEQCLIDSPYMPRETLLADVGKRLTSAGKSRVGLGLRLDQALKSDRFEKTDSGYRLTQEQQASAERFDAASNNQRRNP